MCGTRKGPEPIAAPSCWVSVGVLMFFADIANTITSSSRKDIEHEELMPGDWWIRHLEVRELIGVAYKYIASYIFVLNHDSKGRVMLSWKVLGARLFEYC